MSTQALKLKTGDMCIMHHKVYTADKKLHPNCGQVGKVIGINVDHATVEMEQSSIKGTFLMLPSKMFIQIPGFYAERYSNGKNHYAYRLSERGIKCLKSADCEYMITPRGMGR